MVPERERCTRRAGCRHRPAGCPQSRIAGRSLAWALVEARWSCWSRGRPHRAWAGRLWPPRDAPDPETLVRPAVSLTVVFLGDSITSGHRLAGRRWRSRTGSGERSESPWSTPASRATRREGGLAAPRPGRAGPPPPAGRDRAGRQRRVRADGRASARWRTSGRSRGADPRAGGRRDPACTSVCPAWPATATARPLQEIARTEGATLVEDFLRRGGARPQLRWAPPGRAGPGAARPAPPARSARGAEPLIRIAAGCACQGIPRADRPPTRRWRDVPWVVTANVIKR